MRQLPLIPTLLGVRLSTERFGMEPEEIKRLSQQLIDSGAIDFLDLSLWDVFRPFGPSQEPLLCYFAGLDRRDVRITAAGKIEAWKGFVKG